MRKDVSIKFDEEVLRAIDKEAKLYGASRSNYVNVIMRGILNVAYMPKDNRDSDYDLQRSAKRDSTGGRSAE